MWLEGLLWVSRWFIGGLVTDGADSTVEDIAARSDLWAFWIVLVPIA